MRNRKNISPLYLQDLLQRISTLAESYKQHIDTLWFQKEERATVTALFEKLEKVNPLLRTLSNTAAQKNTESSNDDQEIHLKKVTLKELANENNTHQDANLATYKLILSSLNECYRRSKHQEHEKMQALHALLITELKTQQEAEWHEPNEDFPEQQCISSTLHNLEKHALYASAKEKLYAQKWNIDLSALHELKNNYRDPEDASLPVNPDRALKWDAMCQNQWWHIQRNDHYEISLSAKLVLGLDPENMADCFVLQDSSSIIREMEKELSHLMNKQYMQPEQYRKQIERLRTQKRECQDSGNAAKIIGEIKNLEKKRTDEEKALQNQIIEKIKKIQTQQIQLILKKNSGYPQKHSLSRLHDLYIELSLWTPRNLSIFFIENIIDTQIKKLQHLDTGVTKSGLHNNNEFFTTDTELEKMIDDLSIEMQNILKLVIEAQEKIKHELSLLQKIIDNHYVDTHSLQPFYTSFIYIDAKEAADSFKQYAKDHLLEYTECAHFEAVKKQLSYDEISRHGIVLPRPKDILSPENVAPPITESPLVTNSLRHSKRVLRGLDQLDTTEPRLIPDSVTAQPERAALSTTAKVLISIAIGVAIAIAVAGIIAGIVFSAGAGAAPVAGAALAFSTVVSAKLSTGGLIGLFSGIFAGGLLGGLFRGVTYARLTTPANTPAIQPVTAAATNNAQMHQQLGVTNDVRISTRLGHYSVPTLHAEYGRRTLFRSVTSPAQLASPSARSQGTTIALARSGIRH